MARDRKEIMRTEEEKKNQKILLEIERNQRKSAMWDEFQKLRLWSEGLLVKDEQALCWIHPQSGEIKILSPEAFADISWIVGIDEEIQPVGSYGRSDVLSLEGLGFDKKVVQARRVNPERLSQIRHDLDNLDRAGNFFRHDETHSQRGLERYRSERTLVAKLLTPEVNQVSVGSLAYPMISSQRIIAANEFMQKYKVKHPGDGDFHLLTEEVIKRAQKRYFAIYREYSSSAEVWFHYLQEIVSLVVATMPEPDYLAYKANPHNSGLRKRFFSLYRLPQQDAQFIHAPKHLGKVLLRSALDGKPIPEDALSVPRGERLRALQDHLAKEREYYHHLLFSLIRIGGISFDPKERKFVHFEETSSQASLPILAEDFLYYLQKILPVNQKAQEVLEQVAMHALIMNHFRPQWLKDSELLADLTGDLWKEQHLAGKLWAVQQAYAGASQISFVEAQKDLEAEGEAMTFGLVLSFCSDRESHLFLQDPISIRQSRAVWQRGINTVVGVTRSLASKYSLDVKVLDLSSERLQEVLWDAVARRYRSLEKELSQSKPRVEFLTEILNRSIEPRRDQSRIKMTS